MKKLMNNKTACPSCHSLSVQDVCVYKHLMPEDEIYLNKMSLMRCGECDLVFADAFPSAERLDQYYREVYRKTGRPHFVAHPENVQPDMWHESQYWFISQFVDFGEMNDVVDFGPGYGYLLRKIRAYHPKMNLTASDLDVNSLAYLKNYQIRFLAPEQMKALKNSPEKKFGLVLSSHSLEHEKDPLAFFEMVKDLMSDKGTFFLEVPNTPYSNELYADVSYHGPHLLFFSLQSLRTLLEKGGFDVIHMTTAGTPIALIHVMMRELYHKYNTLKNTNRSTASKILRAFIPQGLKNMIKAGFAKSNENGVDEFFKYGGDRWTIRVIARKNQNG